MTIDSTLKCTACQSSNLCFGYIGGPSNAFIPSGMFTIHGYKIRSYVCLDCGQISQYISMDKLQKLQEKFKSHVRNMES